MNLTSSRRWRRRQFSTAEAQPWPESPRPCTKMTVAVWRAVAGKRSGAARVSDIARQSCTRSGGDRVGGGAIDINRTFRVPIVEWARERIDYAVSCLVSATLSFWDEASEAVAKGGRGS